MCVSGLASVDGMAIAGTCKVSATDSFDGVILVPRDETRISRFAFRSVLDGIEIVGSRLFVDAISNVSPYLYQNSYILALYGMK